ncbi:AAA family ATPase [Sediminibacillus dalangtanensis]|uniref:AAA family ATPase n=1 Tax=Sediminibacillus dalangtanensis TaxID=2729421 RepID=A0ABX7VMU6_9BACI|nr:AAA family ATPase [Sediminibacillus dalangtanensis]QTM98149.1 AAA family ATPase [Sediminibacillus dalangtanensis]
MGIKLKELRIRYFKSYKEADVVFSNNSVLIGANNVGKTSLLQALQFAFTRTKKVNIEDIYIEPDKSLPKSREAIIDALILPVDEDGNELEEFDEVWFEHFGELRSESSDTLNQFVGIRTILKYDKVKDEYVSEKKGLVEWPATEEVLEYSNFKRATITEKILQSVPVFYMDARRDIVLEMKDKTSFWGRMVRDVGLEEEEIEEIEETLDQVNDRIIERSTVLKHLSKNLSKISKTVNSPEESIKIDPVSRKIRDLDRGIDLTFKDRNSERFPISNHGMGTRSWITFLTVVAYIQWKIKQMRDQEIPYHPLVLLEEPEAHLHPQAQRKIFHQINELAGQKIVSTHSPLIVGQVDIEDIRHISKVNSGTKVNSIDTSELDEQEIRKIRQEIFKTRGDLLFANAIILCEGETEEQVIPRFFREYFGCESFEVGTNVISVGGKGKYKPFLRIAYDFNIDIYVLSDGEQETIKKVKKDLERVHGEEVNVEEMENIKFLPNEFDFEEYLISKGYERELLMAIETLFGEGYLDSYIQKKDQKTKGRKPTSEKCDICHQIIYEDKLRDYTGIEGNKEALLDCIHENKTGYSSIIAEIIIESRTDDKVPEIIRDLFKVMNRKLQIIED